MGRATAKFKSAVQQSYRECVSGSFCEAALFLPIKTELKRNKVQSAWELGIVASAGRLSRQAFLFRCSTSISDRRCQSSHHYGIT